MQQKSRRVFRTPSNNFDGICYVCCISGGIGVKILEVVDWSQVSNQLSQLESVAATRISRS